MNLKIVKGDENENTGQYSQSGVLLIDNLNLTKKSQTGPELHSNSDFRMLIIWGKYSEFYFEKTQQT